MRTIKYIIILLVMISAASFTGCNEKKLDEHGHEAGTHAESNEKESPEQHKPGKSEEESEHEELPDDIVELNAEQIKLAGITLGKVENASGKRNNKSQRYSYHSTAKFSFG
ncbi:MAG: hypothetical protein IPH57_17670 [Saprospiraceae bacterium]|nr:hypothetical protein [Saprospiraceae bacterium]